MNWELFVACGLVMIMGLFMLWILTSNQIHQGRRIEQLVASTNLMIKALQDFTKDHEEIREIVSGLDKRVRELEDEMEDTSDTVRKVMSDYSTIKSEHMIMSRAINRTEQTVIKIARKVGVPEKDLEAAVGE